MYRFIRKGKGMTQKEVCNDFLDRTTLSRIEKNETEPRFENACYLLERIDVSLDEFRYLANIDNRDNRDNRTRLIEDFYSIISNTESAQIRKLYRRCLEFTSTCSDKKIEEILLILRLYLSADPIDFDKTEFKGLVTPIWQRLSKIEVWTLRDIQIFAIISFHLEISTLEIMYPILLATLDRYNRLDVVDTVRLTLLMNISQIYIQKKLVEDGRYMLNLAKDMAKRAKRADFLGMIFVRLGYCQNDTKLMQKGFDLLEVVEETELKAKLLKELQYYRQRK